MTQLFACIIFEGKNNTLRAHTIKNKKIIQTYDKSFESKEMLLEYLKDLSKDFQLYYVSVFFDATAQGLVPTSNPKELDKFGVNAKNVQCISIENAQIYAAKNSLEEFKKLFSEYGGLDLIYSPLILLYYHARLAKLDPSKITLCIYRHVSCVALMICRGKEILFGNFFDIAEEKTNTEEDEEEGEESPQNEEDFDFQGLEKMLNEKLDDLKESSGYQANLTDFANDMNMCRYVFSSIQEYYNNPIYNGNFIDDLLIFDTENISEAILDYIEGEIFLKPRVIKVDTLDTMGELMKKELKA